jgi:hypothetical protein
MRSNYDSRWMGPVLRAARSLRAAFEPRRLLAEERNFLEREFGASLDFDALRIAGGGQPLGRVAWQPMAALIQLADSCFEADDPARAIRHEALPIFAHEALHVWQRVHRHCAVHVSVDGLWLGIAHGVRAYRYDTRLADPADLLREFLAGNIERQGQMFEDYVRSNVHVLRARDPKFADIAQYVRAKISGPTGRENAAGKGSTRHSGSSFSM